MRETVQELVLRARRSAERIDVDPLERAPAPLEHIANETIRLARMATSIHLVAAARPPASCGRDADASMREHTR